MSSTVSYKGSAIATINNNTKTLKTAGKYLEGDIIITDASGAISNQNKTVNPTTSQQTITADSGYTGLGTVTVNAIPYAMMGENGITGSFTTVNGIRKWVAKGNIDYDPYGYVGTNQSTDDIYYNAIASSTTITPTESSQKIGGANYMMEGAVTVNAIPSNYVGSGITSRSSSDLTASGAIVTVPAGYYSSQATKAVSSGSATGPSSLSASSATITTGTNTITLTKTNVTTTPTVSAGYVASATTSTATVALTASVTVNPTPTASGATVTIPAGYYSSQTTKSVSNGSATGPSSLSGTSATVSTGTNTLTLTKTGVTTTPTVSAGYVSSATASTATVSLTASINTRSSSDLTASNLTVTAPSGYYANAATKTLSDANLVAGNIKKNVTIFGTTGTYEGSGGGGDSGSNMVVATATKTLTSTASSISFTGLSGEPTSFAVTSSADQTTGGTKVVAITYNGEFLYGIDLTTQATNDSGFTQSYSNGTLTITATTASFQANEYKLVYSYGGTAANIGGREVQVGSGATSITFTGLEEEPEYFSCIFKSTFSTSSGYQRTMEVVYDGTSTYGHALDSSAHALTSWSYTYNNGSLTISSIGTNNGGYFHQPGYYQLTYAIGGLSGNYQSKTVYATSSQQVVTADSGYDALKQVTIPAVTTTNLIASNILSGVTIQVGDAADSDRITSITGNVVLQNYYTGSSAPASYLGSNGDLYLQV